MPLFETSSQISVLGAMLNLWRHCIYFKLHCCVILCYGPMCYLRTNRSVCLSLVVVNRQASIHDFPPFFL